MDKESENLQINYSKEYDDNYSEMKRFFHKGAEII